jgi:hypothetical protein
MLTKWQFGVLTALGIAALVLVIADAVLVTRNLDARSTLGQRQQFIQQSMPLEALYRDIVKTLAETGIKSGDRQLLGVLSAQGINVTFQGSGGGSDADPAPKNANRK